MGLWDTISTQNCLAGKYVLFLGDSTITETVHDVVLLLAGLGKNNTAANIYALNATRYFHPL